MGLKLPRCNEECSPEVRLTETNQHHGNNQQKKISTHYRNRKKIMTSKDPGRYILILREVCSGRYAQFANSWRTMFRDLLL